MLAAARVKVWEETVWLCQLHDLQPLNGRNADELERDVCKQSAAAMFWNHRSSLTSKCNARDAAGNF
jgi:hypothetical protein